jgi:predicted  nucleic acid-binding Zn-ribbon protein
MDELGIGKIVGRRHILADEGCYRNHGRCVGELRMSRIALTVLAATLMLGGATQGPALGQNAAPAGGKADIGTKSGPPTQRYRFTHTAEGVLRLDNETGEAVLCHTLNGGWVCNPVPQGDALKVELQRRDDEVKKLTTQFVQLKGDISQSQDAATAGRKSLEDEIAKLQAAIAGLKADVAALSAAKPAEATGQGISQEERQGIVSRLALLEQDNGGLKGALKRLQDENAALTKRLAEAPKPRDLEPAIAKAIDANDALKRELAATRDQVAALQKQVAEQAGDKAQQAEIARLKDENRTLTDRLASLETSNAEMQAEIDGMKAPPPLPKADVPAEKKDELKLPSREEMERAKAALTDAWRKLMDMIGQMQKDMLGGKDNPPVRL